MEKKVRKAFDNGTEVWAEDERGRKRPGVVTTQVISQMNSNVADGLIVRFSDKDNGFITIPYGYIDPDDPNNSVVTAR